MSIQLNNKKMVLIPAVTQLKVDTRPSWAERIFDVLRAGIGEMQSTPLTVELLQYEQNSVMRNLGGHLFPA
jgi:hypothetical protein